MPTFDTAIILIPLLAVLAPIAARLLGRWVRVPIVVFELVLGILVGPSVLGWVQPSEMTAFLAQVGLAVLFFVAGSEINFGAIAGRPLTRSLMGWVVSLVVGIGLGLLVAPGEAGIIIAIALSSTALGTLLPILRDAGELDTPFGRAVSALGAVGEFGPLVAISLFLGAREIGPASLVLLGFVAITALAIILALRMPHGRLHRFFASSLHNSGQFAVRLIMLILGALVALSIVLSLDILLGAFAAGVIWQLLMRNAPEEDREQVDSKIEAIGFGFLVPIFFIYTGVTFDLGALLSDGSVLVLVPIGLLLLLVVRGLPSMLSAPAGTSTRERIAVGLLGATGLPIIVAVTSIGVAEGILASGVAAAIVGAGMLSVLLFPLIAMAVRGTPSRPSRGEDLVAEEA